MKRIIFATALASCIALPTALASHGGPINTTCPISKEPITPTAATVQHAGHEIGLCCGGCGKAFLAWDETRRDEYVALALRDGESDHDASQDAAGHDETAAAPATDTRTSFPYPLDVCVVSGEELGSMGEPIVLDHEGREIKVCCKGCVGTFEANPAEYIEKIDAKIIETSMMHYPLDICVVTGAKLGSMGDPIDMVYNNRLIRVCCPPCVPKIRKDPAKYLAAIDELIVAQQVEAYPLKTCAVAGSELGGMGEPFNYIHDNRLVRFCCGGCVGRFEADPATHMAKLDAAYADAQRDAYPIDTCVVGGGELGSMGEPVEVVAGTTLVRFCCKGCLPRFEADPAKYLAKLKTD